MDRYIVFKRLKCLKCDHVTSRQQMAHIYWTLDVLFKDEDVKIKTKNNLPLTIFALFGLFALFALFALNGVAKMCPFDRLDNLSHPLCHAKVCITVQSM